MNKWPFIYHLRMLKSLPHLILFRNSQSKSIIEKDISRWVEIQNSAFSMNHPERNLNWLIRGYPEFRNLFYYRISRGKKYSSFLLRLAKKTFPKMDTLYIYVDDLGAGFFIQHGFSTMIAAKSIGENCFVSQQVTIGFSNRTNSPVIGNNVVITSGAKIIGGIKLGDNVVVGANAVVVKNVPANCTVVGVPAFIVKRNGLRINEKL